MSKLNLRGPIMKISERRGMCPAVQFSNIAIDQWNTLLEELVCAKSLNNFQEKYDKWILKDGTMQAGLNPANIQIGKYTPFHCHSYKHSETINKPLVFKTFLRTDWVTQHLPVIFIFSVLCLERKISNVRNNFLNVKQVYILCSHCCFISFILLGENINEKYIFILKVASALHFV